nr:MAG: protein of unknown function (DUF1064) [Bacteriophage sp.]
MTYLYRKYHNTKTVVDGIKFDSKLEAERYAQLKILERAGVIKGLELQPSFELLPSFRKNGKAWRKTVYKADFRYILAEGDRIIVEDVKGSTAVITDVFRLKQKLFEYKYPEYTISIVTSKDVKKFQIETKVSKMC